MSRFTIIALACAAFFTIFVVTSYISFYNTAVRLENTTTSQFNQNQNAYDNYWKAVTEATQIPPQYKSDFQELLVAEAATTFGPGGSKATVQWLQQRNIVLSDALYIKLMTMIESGRQNFMRNQQTLLDKQRRYRDHLDSFWGSIWAQTSGHPKQLQGQLAPPMDLDGDGLLTVLDYPIVLSSKTSKAFQTGEDEAIQVFKN